MRLLSERGRVALATWALRRRPALPRPVSPRPRRLSKKITTGQCVHDCGDAREPLRIAGKAVTRWSPGVDPSWRSSPSTGLCTGRGHAHRNPRPPRLPHQGRRRGRRLPQAREQRSGFGGQASRVLPSVTEQVAAAGGSTPRIAAPGARVRCRPGELQPRAGTSLHSCIHAVARAIADGEQLTDASGPVVAVPSKSSGRITHHRTA